MHSLSIGAARTAAAVIGIVIAASSAAAQVSARPALGTARDFARIRFDSVPLATGVRINFAERGDPNGEPVIMLHGYSDSWQSFSLVMPLFPTRFRLFALDQRGHGSSARPDGGYRMKDLAADVLAFMDARGIGRATLIGHSMGSLVAQQVALSAPERVQKLVLIGSGTATNHLQGFAELRAAVTELRDPVSIAFIREFQYSTIALPVSREHMDAVIVASQRLPARVWHAAMAGMWEVTPATELDGRGIPTLIVQGDRDSVFPLPELARLRELLPRARVAVYEGVGHTPHWEMPDRFTRDVTTFLVLGRLNAN